MILLLDIGNTLCKWAVVKDNEIVARGIVVIVNACFIESLKAKFYTIDTIVVSTVKQLSEDFVQHLENNYHYFEFNSKLPLPLHICYQSPQTLGVDRLAAACGAVATFPNRNILVIDAGTAITIDFVSAAREYRGGNISPGISMRFKALHQQTDKLPLVQYQSTFKKYGEDTESAIRAGVQQGVINELRTYINDAYEEYENLKIVLTGGDSAFILGELQKSIPTNHYNDIFSTGDLVFLGMLSVVNL